MKTIKITYKDGSYSFWDFTTPKLDEILSMYSLSETLIIKIEIY